MSDRAVIRPGRGDAARRYLSWLAVFVALLAPGYCWASTSGEFSAAFQGFQSRREKLILSNKGRQAAEVAKEMNEFLESSAREAASAGLPPTDPLVMAIKDAVERVGDLSIMPAAKAAELKALLEPPKKEEKAPAAETPEPVSTSPSESADGRPQAPKEPGAEDAAGSAAPASCDLGKLPEIVTTQFSAYEGGDVSGFMKHVAPSFQSFDRFMLGLNRSSLERAIGDDLRNLKDVNFTVRADAPSGDGPYRMPVVWTVRARLGDTGKEWVAENQSSTLRYVCENGSFLLEALEGENLFGRSGFTGATVLDKGSVDGTQVTAPVGLISGGEVDPSLMVGFSGVPGTASSVSQPVEQSSATTQEPSFTVASFTPSSAFITEGIGVDIAGTNFVSGAPLAVELAPGQSNACAFSLPTAPTVVSGTQLSFFLYVDGNALGVGGTTYPSPHTVDVKVTNGDGTSRTVPAAFTITGPKLTSMPVSSFANASPPSTFWESVTITGENFLSSVGWDLISSDPATTVLGVTRVNDTTLTADLSGSTGPGAYTLELGAFAAPGCSPFNAHSNVTVTSAGTLSYTINP